MRFEYCDYDKENLTTCWAVDGGRFFLHLTNNLSELLTLRKLIDEMIKDLFEEKAKKDEEHRLSLRASRAKRSKKKK